MFLLFILFVLVVIFLLFLVLRSLLRYPTFSLPRFFRVFLLRDSLFSSLRFICATPSFLHCDFLRDPLVFLCCDFFRVAPLFLLSVSTLARFFASFPRISSKIATTSSPRVFALNMLVCRCLRLPNGNFDSKKHHISVRNIYKIFTICNPYALNSPRSDCDIPSAMSSGCDVEPSNHISLVTAASVVIS